MACSPGQAQAAERALQALSEGRAARPAVPAFEEGGSDADAIVGLGHAFEDVDATHDQRIINRAGFFRTGTDTKREFLVLPEAFKRDVCAGFDAKAATRCLIAHSWIAPGGDGRATQKPRLPGIGTARVFVFTSKVWEGNE